MPNNLNQPSTVVTNLLSQVSAAGYVTGARAIDGTVYHNATARAIFALVSIYLGTSTANYTVMSDSTANPISQISVISTPTAVVDSSVFFIVLPGYYYRITKAGTATLTAWIEWT